MKNIHKHEEHTPKKTNTNQIKQFHQSTIDSDLCTYKIKNKKFRFQWQIKNPQKIQAPR